MTDMFARYMAKIEELKAEVERLRSMYWAGDEENNELRAENERLRAALLVARQWMPVGAITQIAKQLVDAALEPKP